MAPAPPEHYDFPRYLREWMHASVRYVRTRLELAGLEGKEAMARIGGVLLLVVVAITLMLAGYLLMCLAFVFGIARLLHTEHAWIWIAAAFGTLHLLGAWGILKMARSWMEKPMFPASLEEFRKDETWLKSTVEKPR